MKLINFTQTLFTRSAGRRVPLIRFPDRHGLNKTTNTATSIPTNTTTPISNKIKNYSTDISNIPQRLKMRNDEMDMIISGGAY